MSPPKKPRIDQGPSSRIASTAWNHYRNFLDSVDPPGGAGDDVGDIDELVELLEILEPHLKSNSRSSISLGGATRFNSITSLLPVLASVAHYHLAATGIAETVDSSLDSNDDVQHQRQDIERHLQQSLEHFDQNAATHSMQANYQRMCAHTSLHVIAENYEKAADCASAIRKDAVQLLESETVQDEVKEWIELLLLDAVAGVEYVGGDDERGEENGHHDLESDHSKTMEDVPDDSDFSCSAVESTARFMAAMIFSTLQKHGAALHHIQNFDLTHRLHPNVWQQQGTTGAHDTLSKQEPACFTHPVLPNSLYDRLCHVLAPVSPYWTESDYAHRGYYSYYFDLDDSKRPNNLIEDIIVKNLLPLANKVLLNGGDEAKIVGAEWWPHTRPVRANLGHQLHFDTDEALLGNEGKITHPILSSVLYLTGGEDTGPTVILDQTPDSTIVASSAWKSVPRNNTYIVFPGNLLHGVLPCPGDGEASTISTASTPHHRLTFMVGFWTRRVPDGIKEHRLYGPCGSLPPATEEHTWVQSIREGYRETDGTSNSNTATDRTAPPQTRLPQVYPAWEVMSRGGRTGSSSPPLQIPKALDHRYFVKDAPESFRNSLFTKDDDEEHEGADG